MPSGAHAHTNPCVATTLNPPHYARGAATISTETEWPLSGSIKYVRWQPLGGTVQQQPGLRHLGYALK